MATYVFGVSAVWASLTDQAVYIRFNLDIDEETTDDSDIYLMDRSARRVVPFTIEVNMDTVKLNLQEWATPNTAYSLVVQPGIQSVVGDELQNR